MAYLGVGYSLVVLFEGFYAWLTSLSFESLLIVAASRSLHVILNCFSLLVEIINFSLIFLPKFDGSYCTNLLDHFTELLKRTFVNYPHLQFIPSFD